MRSDVEPRDLPVVLLALSPSLGSILLLLVISLCARLVAPLVVFAARRSPAAERRGAQVGGRGTRIAVTAACAV
jgi:hypothetical protein